MIELQPNDLHFVLARLPKDVHRLLTSHPGRMYLAGGFIRAVIAGETVNDIDLLATTQSSCARLLPCSLKAGKGLVRTRRTTP